MPCILDNGLALGCNVVGGVKRVWLGNYDGMVTYDDTTDPDGIITALIDNPNSVDCYNFEQDIEFAGLEQPVTPSRENGTVFYESTLTLKFIHLDANLRNRVLALNKAALFGVVESNEGDYYLLGVESPGRVSEGSASLGTALGDMNGATMSILFKSKNGAYLCDGAILNTGVADPTLITVNATT